MSPKVLWPFVFALLGSPSFVLATEPDAVVERTSTQPASDELVRDAQEHRARTQNAILLRKDFHADLSREPMPLTRGPFRLAAFHVFPTQRPGPYLGSPMKLWGSGFGTTLWRNAVTGWPEL